MRFEPALDFETRQLLIVEDDELDLHVFDCSRPELLDELQAHILFAWDSYALAPPETLTPAAQELGAAYRRRLRETADAQT